MKHEAAGGDWALELAFLIVSVLTMFYTQSVRPLKIILGLETVYFLDA